MRATRWGLVTGALFGALLMGCGDDDDGGGDAAAVDAEPASDEAGGSGGDTYVGALADGSELRIRLDVPADDPAVVPFEAFRVLTGAPEPTWIVGEVTVPDGVDDGTGRFVTFLEEGADWMDDDPLDDTDGVTNSEFACSVLQDWFESVDAPDEALNDAYLELYEGPCGNQTLQVVAPGGQTTTYVMVYEGELPDFATVESELGNALEPA